MEIEATRVPGLPDAISPSTRQRAWQILSRIVAAHATRLAGTFYRILLADPEATPFLSSSLVEARLVHSLTDWLLELFPEQETGLSEAFADRQRKVGEVHARIKIPVSLVIKSAAVLKTETSALLLSSPAEREDLVAALILLNTRVDWAIGLMSETYVQSTVRRAQIDEAFRLFAVGQDVTLERESQRAALMEWLQGNLFALFQDGAPSRLKPISGSPFGLWLRHRAGLMFQGLPSLETLHDTLRRIDSIILPKIEDAKAAGGQQLPAQLAQLNTVIDEIKYLLGSLFQSVAGIESARDPLTRALNRRFLPTILGREMAIASQTGTPFAVLMIDVDHFKQINDRWGHGAGDLVLGQVAELVLDAVRLNDFVFRYGGEEFLVALVETGAEEALAAAERVRALVAEREFRLPDGGHLQVTASIGVAVFDGHPDFVHLIEAADRALYRAKQSGRNRSVMANA